ncbi:MAG: hypothetical protein WD052_05645 [Bacteroidales bacterium]
MNRRFFRIICLPLALTAGSCTYNFYPASCDYPTTGPLKRITTLSDTLNETSGLASTGNGFVSFNDSGGEPALYTFTSNSSNLTKTIIQGATNVDWEDIAFDGTSFFIADVGNNFGTRDTLVIYKIPALKPEGELSINGADKITFTYDEEKTVSSRGFYSHDCEAVLAYGDSLYLFAKDWVTLNTRVYVLPKTQGHYQVKSRVTYPVNALITGADIDIGKREVILSGYRYLFPVLIRYSFISDPAIIECGGRGRRYPSLSGTQVEGVCYDESGNIFVTSEKRVFKQALYRAY